MPSTSIQVGQQITYAVACEDTGVAYSGTAHEDISLLPLKRSAWSRLANTVGVGDTLDPPANRVIMDNRIDATDGLPDYLWWHGIMIWGAPGATTAGCTMLRLTSGGAPVAIIKATGTFGTGGMQLQAENAAGSVLFTTRDNALPVAGLTPIEITVRLSYLTAPPSISNQVAFYGATAPYSPVLQARPNIFASVPPDTAAVVTGSTHNDGTYDIAAKNGNNVLEFDAGVVIVSESAEATVTIDLLPSANRIISNRVAFGASPTAPSLSVHTDVFSGFPSDNVAVVSGSTFNDGTYDVKTAPTGYALLLQQGTTLHSEGMGAAVTIELKPSMSLFINGSPEGLYAGALDDHVDGAECSSPCDHVSTSWTELAYTDCRLINGGVLTMGATSHADTFEWTVATGSILSIYNDNDMVITGDIDKIAEWNVSTAKPAGGWLVGSIVTEARVSTSKQGSAPEKFAFTAAVKNDAGAAFRTLSGKIAARTTQGNFQHSWNGGFELADITAGRVATGIKSQDST